jgi:hypothetical protein
MLPSKTQGVLFLGEQDGVPEGALKNALSECLQGVPGIAAAYLVRLSYAETHEPQVALCIDGGDQERELLVECVGAIFGKLFSMTAHLDILFLSEVQARAVAKIAKSFYPMRDRSE